MGKFSKVIQKALTAGENVGTNTGNHFRDVTKMVKIGSDAERSINDVMLTRYACYLIAQNGDLRKEPIAFAQAVPVKPPLCGGSCGRTEQNDFE